MKVTSASVGVEELYSDFLGGLDNVLIFDIISHPLNQLMTTMYPGAFPFLAGSIIVIPDNSLLPIIPDRHTLENVITSEYFDPPLSKVLPALYPGVFPNIETIVL